MMPLYTMDTRSSAEVATHSVLEPRGVLCRSQKKPGESDRSFRGEFRGISYAQYRRRQAATEPVGAGSCQGVVLFELESNFFHRLEDNSVTRPHVLEQMFQHQ